MVPVTLMNPIETLVHLAPQCGSAHRPAASAIAPLAIPFVEAPEARNAVGVQNTLLIQEHPESVLFFLVLTHGQSDRVGWVQAVALPLADTPP